MATSALRQDRTHRTRQQVLILAAIAGLCMTEALAFQWLAGAFTRDYSATHPDEAAHFVSALMVRDYLVGLHWLNPVGYAREYYVHYPKVAIGHWPPLFYGVLAVWMLCFGISRASMMVFVAACAAGVATVVYEVGRRMLGAWAGAFGAVVYVALPLAQESTGRLMTDHAVTLLLLLSALAFARFLQTERARDSVVFGAVAALAIMTRGSAWALALVPPLTILFTGRFDVWRRGALWLSFVPVVTVCVPWYVATSSIWAYDGSLQGDALAAAIRALTGFPVMLWESAGPLLSLLAVAGAAVTVGRRGRLGGDATWAALAALMLATLIIHCAVPAGAEPRYVLPLVPGLLVFAAAGLHWLVTLAVRPPRAVPVLRVAMVLVAAVTLTGAFSPDADVRDRGYQRLAGVLRTSGLRSEASVVLAVSDSSGEGGIVAAIASQEERPATFVLRASKVVGREDWMGRSRGARFESVTALRILLDQIPVDAVVFDDTARAAASRAYRMQLRDAVTGSDRWRELEVPSPPRRTPAGARVQVYVRRAAPDEAWPPTDRALIGRLVLPTRVN